MTAFSRFRRPPAGAHAAWARGEDPFAGDAVSGEAATEALARMTPEDRPLGSLVEEPPPVVLVPRPSFTPRASGPQTRADLVIPDPLSRRFPVPVTVRPAIGDSLGCLPELRQPPAVPAPGANAMLYSGPGWAGQLMAARLRNGEVDELPALVEAGLGRNAAECQTAFRHAREKITAGALRLCATLGHPDLTGALLGRVHELNVTAQAQARGGADL